MAIKTKSWNYLPVFCHDHSFPYVSVLFLYFHADTGPWSRSWELFEERTPTAGARIWPQHELGSTDYDPDAIATDQSLLYTVDHSRAQNGCIHAWLGIQ